ncbi:MAG: hypothetical protein M3431_11100 [Actinomycetota bacterium]|nr:hypothetical protein [Actinomycetota bacterium]
MQHSEQSNTVGDIEAEGTQRRIQGAVLLTMLLLVGCGSGDGGGSRPCAEVFADGATPPDGDDLVACRDANGEETMVGSIGLVYDECTVYVNDYGWWVEGGTVTGGPLREPSRSRTNAISRSVGARTGH